MANPKHDGITINLGGADFVVPPMNLKTLKKLVGKIEQLSKTVHSDRLPTPEEFTLIAEVAHEALKRNYPELTFDEVEERVDMRNIFPLFEAVMAATGFAQVAASAPTAAPGVVTPGEGERPGVSTGSASTGA